tara:strand:+ start:35 stop:379 length:345 start_codon:yes stop_codon:yes gene_type:complete
MHNKYSLSQTEYKPYGGISELFGLNCGGFIGCGHIPELNYVEKPNTNKNTRSKSRPNNTIEPAPRPSNTIESAPRPSNTIEPAPRPSNTIEPAPRPSNNRPTVKTIIDNIENKR